MTRKNSPPSSPKAPSGRSERAGRGASAPRAQASGPSRGRASAPERRAPSKRLMNIVPVQLRANFTRSECDAQEMMLEVGQEVIVETPRGPVLATVRGPIQRKYLMAEGVLRVVRKATPEDVEQAIAYERREQDAYRFAIERIRARDLPMKLVRAQFLLDGSKLVYFFSAEGRVDFRELVKDLAHRFRARIEMHQIGVRDGARMLGGVGPCGRELCCSTFLESFAPVSIRMAKDQGLTLNPKKVSGMCGRLMCCLVYEQQLYRSMRRRVPRPGTVVFTEAGKGVITSVDVIAATAQVELEDMNRRVFPLVELASSEPRQREVIDAAPPAPAPPALNPDLLWEDVLRDFDEELVRDAGLLEPSEQAASEERAGRRGRSRRRKKDEPTTSAASAEAEPDASPSVARPARPARPAKPTSARPAPAKPAKPAPARGRQAPPAQAHSPQGQASPGDTSASGVVDDAQGQRRKRPRRGRRGDAQAAAPLNQAAPVGARPSGGAEPAAEPAPQGADRRAKTRRPRGQGRAQGRGTSPQSQSQPQSAQPQSAQPQPQPQPRPRAEGKGETRAEGRADGRAEGRAEGAERRRRPRRRKKEEGAQGGDKAD